MTDEIENEEPWQPGPFRGDNETCPDFNDELPEMPDKLPEFCSRNTLLKIASFVPPTPVFPVFDPIPLRDCPCPKSSNPRYTFDKSGDCCDWTLVVNDPKLCVPRIEYVEAAPGEREYGKLEVEERCDGDDYDIDGVKKCCPVYIFTYSRPKCPDGYSLGGTSDGGISAGLYNFRIPVSLTGGGRDKCESTLSLSGAGGAGGGVPCPHVKISGHVKVGDTQRGIVTQVDLNNEDEEETDKKVKVNPATNQCEQNIKLKIDLDDLSTLTCSGSPFGAKLEYIVDEDNRNNDKWRLTMNNGIITGPFPGMRKTISFRDKYDNGYIEWYAKRASGFSECVFWADYTENHVWELKNTPIATLDALLDDDIVGGAVLLFTLTGTQKKPRVNQIRCENVIIGNQNAWPSWHAEAYGSNRHGYDIVMAPGIVSASTSPIVSQETSHSEKYTKWLRFTTSDNPGKFQIKEVQNLNLADNASNIPATSMYFYWTWTNPGDVFEHGKWEYVASMGEYDDHNYHDMVINIFMFSIVPREDDPQKHTCSITQYTEGSIYIYSTVNVCDVKADSGQQGSQSANDNQQNSENDQQSSDQGQQNP